MRVQINEYHTLQIDFHKEHRVKGKKDLIDTLCIVYELSGPGKSIIAQARSKQNPSDTYSKVVGKKIALTKALDFVNIHNMCNYNDSLVKEARTKIWKTFNDTFKRWR